jgi:hypothetical protein
MANAAITRMAKRMVDRLKKADVRVSVEKSKGQIFIWKKADFIDYMTKQGVKKEDVDKLVSLWETKLQAQDKRQLNNKERGKRLAAVKASVIANKIENFDPNKMRVYAVYNYGSVARIKTTVGKYLEQLTGKDKSLVTGQVKGGSKAGQTPGTHIGHGEFGHAVSSTRALSAEAVMKTSEMEKLRGTHSSAFTKLEASLARYKQTVGINGKIEHYQEVSARGGLKKEYTAILSSQGAGDNLLEALSEKEAFAELKKSIEQDYDEILNQHGSDSLLEGIESTLLHNFAKQHNIKVLKGKPKRISKSSSRGKAKGKKRIEQSAAIISGAGGVQRKTSRRITKSITSKPLQLIGLINQALPKTVRGNMNAPALENRSGRFVDSVEVTDITQTPQGYPSIGYRYAKNPYQVYEMGVGSAPWATPERDPRKLIDRSIREIAAQFAIGRFYTRRV